MTFAAQCFLKSRMMATDVQRHIDSTASRKKGCDKRQIWTPVGVPSLREAVQLSRELNVYAYDAYVIACAINQRAPILSLDNVLKERAQSIKLDV